VTEDHRKALYDSKLLQETFLSWRR